jgi:probable phosphoglycerate mutase
MRVLLVRHGQTPSNVAGLLDTAEPGPGLTDLGRRQAEAVPGALVDRGVDAVVVSSLVRTAQTAAPLARRRELSPLVVPGFREVEAGALEMAADHGSHRTYLETVFAWSRGDLGRRMPGASDGAAFLARFDEAMAAVAALAASTVVVVSHGAAIRSWSAARVAGMDVEEVESTPLANTGAVEVDGDPERGWELVAWTRHPLGGAQLEAVVGDDPTGESVERA